MWQLIPLVGRPMQERQRQRAADRAQQAAAVAQQNERNAAFQRLRNQARQL